MGVTVRAAALEDLPAILRIYNHYVTRTIATFELEPVTLDGRRDWFHEHAGPGPHRLLVADAGPPGGVVGWASSSSFRPRAAYATTVESSVYLEPGWTGQGLGTRLYRELFALLATEDLERIVACIALPNPASVVLHERMGFTPVGTFTHVGRKFGKFWDVLWVQRPSRDAPGPPAPTP